VEGPVALVQEAGCCWPLVEGPVALVEEKETSETLGPVLGSLVLGSQ
jgi:hypothetical protein